MQKLLIASRNPGKIREIKEILSGITYEIKSLIDINCGEEIQENGRSFQENAIIKAKEIGEKTKLLTLGEDSGLEIDALGGRPGIYSARFVKGTDADRIDKILEEMKGIPKEKRTARFSCVIVLYNPQSGKMDIFEGVSNGVITEKPIGTSGFGYDPIFFNLDLGKTNAQASLIEKSSASHRGRALLQLKEFLEKLN